VPCFFPRTGYRSSVVNPTGLRSTVWKASQSHFGETFPVPCGRCIYCRVKNSRETAIRVAHEAQLYEQNCFVTLTYAPEHLPEFGSLNYDHPVTFMKDLRARVAYQEQKWRLEHRPIRSFGCAEYGEKKSRPHYHLILFNYDFPDKVFFKKHNGNDYFTSWILKELWPYGHSIVTRFTYETGAYVSRYVTKKITGPKAEKHYRGVDPRSGVEGPILPERSVCRSLRPGLGAYWLEKYMGDVYPRDEVVMQGRTMRPPKYYDLKYSVENVEDYIRLKNLRKERSLEAVPLTRKRLSQLHDVAKLKFRKYERGYEKL